MLSPIMTKTLCAAEIKYFDRGFYRIQKPTRKASHRVNPAFWTSFRFDRCDTTLQNCHFRKLFFPHHTSTKRIVVCCHFWQCHKVVYTSDEPGLPMHRTSLINKKPINQRHNLQKKIMEMKMALRTCARSQVYAFS